MTEYTNFTNAYTQQEITLPISINEINELNEKIKTSYWRRIDEGVFVYKAETENVILIQLRDTPKEITKTLLVQKDKTQSSEDNAEAVDAAYGAVVQAYIGDLRSGYNRT